MYQLIEEELDDGNGGERIAYGIAYAGEQTAKIHDLSGDRCYIEELVSIFNNLQLSPIHLEDVLEDLL